MLQRIIDLYERFFAFTGEPIFRIGATVLYDNATIRGDKEHVRSVAIVRERRYSTTNDERGWCYGLTLIRFTPDSEFMAQYVTNAFNVPEHCLTLIAR